MKKFQQNVNRELKRQTPERLRLEVQVQINSHEIRNTQCLQCISTISFVRQEKEVLDCPIWIMLINVVALEMLKAKMPGKTGNSFCSNIFRLTDQFVPGHPVNPIKFRLPVGSSSDEDPYSNDASSRSSGTRGGVLAQEKDYYGPQDWAGHAEVSDLSDEYMEVRAKVAKSESMFSFLCPQQVSNIRERYKSRGRSRTAKKGPNRLEGKKAEYAAISKTLPHLVEDPYFNGQSAHVTPFRGQQCLERTSYKSASRQAVKNLGMIN